MVPLFQKKENKDKKCGEDPMPNGFEILFAIAGFCNCLSDLNAYYATQGYLKDICSWADDDDWFTLSRDYWCSNSSFANVTNASTWHETWADDDDFVYGDWAYQSWDEFCGSWDGDDYLDWCHRRAKGGWRADIMNIILAFVIVDLVWDCCLSYYRWNVPAGRENKGKTKRIKVAGCLVIELVQFACQTSLLCYFLWEQGDDDLMAFNPQALIISLVISVGVMFFNGLFVCGMLTGKVQRDSLGAKSVYSAAKKAEGATEVFTGL